VSEDDKITASEPDTTPPEPDPLFASYQPVRSPQKGEIFWGWHDFFLFIFVTVMSLAMAMLAGIGIRRLFHLSEAHMNIVFVIAQFAAYGVAFACLKLMFRAEYGQPLLESLHWWPSGIEPARLALIGLGQAFTIAMIGAFMSVPKMDTPMNRLLADRPTAIVIAILGATVAPIAEELAFRGLLQPLLIRAIGAAPGILITALLFGAMHFEQYGAWQSVVLITLAGVGFGVMRHWTGSTRAAAFMHAGYNSALFLLFFTQRAPHS
jgi:membrane protease YdiL (CAAX protease family)